MTSDVVLLGAPRGGQAPARPALGVRGIERLVVGSAVAAIALLPLLRPAGPGNTAPIDALIAVAVLGAFFWATGTRRVMRFPLVLPLGLILVGGALGAISGPVPRSGIVALVQDIGLLLWFWAVVNIAGSVERLQLILRTWTYAAIGWAVALFASLAAGITAISGQTDYEGARTALTLGNPNFAGHYFVVSIMIVWATGRPRHLGARLVAYGLLLAALVSTGSNGALVSFAVGTIVACILGVYRRAGLVAAMTALAGIALAGAVLATTISVNDVQSRASQSSYAFLRDGVGRSEKTASDRGVLFRQQLRLYETGGLLGAGPGSTKVRLTDESAPRVAEAHNDYLAALNERGVIGLLGTLLLIAGVGRRALSLATAPTTGRIAEAIVNPNALAGAVAATFVAMTTTEYLHTRHLWTLFAFVVAAALLARE